MITSAIVPTHQPRVVPIEAWQYNGQKFANWPDWVQSQFPGPNKPRKTRGTWALRDDEGYFWRWMDKETFALRYESLLVVK